MNRRYVFFKRLFSNYLLLFINDNGNLISYGSDYKLMLYIKRKKYSIDCINYILFKNLFIKDMSYIGNSYCILDLKYKLFNILTKNKKI